MLKAVMKVKFYKKREAMLKNWTGYHALIVFRPAFNLGGYLSSGEIHPTDDTDVYLFGREYTVLVYFRLIFSEEVYQIVRPSLEIGREYSIQLGGEVIGEAQLIQYGYE